MNALVIILFALITIVAILYIVAVVFLIMGVVRQFHDRKNEGDLVREQYPDIAKKELRKRRRKIATYANRQFPKAMLILGIGLMIVVFTSGISLGISIVKPNMYSLAVVLLLVFVWVDARAIWTYRKNKNREMSRVLHEYIDKNPENEMKVVFIPEDLFDHAVQTMKIIIVAVTLLIVTVGLLIVTFVIMNLVDNFLGGM